MSNSFFASNSRAQDPKAPIQPSNPTNPQREIEKISLSWKKNFNELSSRLLSYEAKTNTIMSNLFINELKLIETVNTLQSIANHHNNLDDILNTLISRQNAIVGVLDDIEEKMYKNKGIEDSSVIESWEELDEKSKNFVRNKNEIDKMTEILAKKFEKPVSSQVKSLPDQLNYATFLQSSFVRVI